MQFRLHDAADNQWNNGTCDLFIVDIYATYDRVAKEDLFLMLGRSLLLSESRSFWVISFVVLFIVFRAGPTCLLLWITILEGCGDVYSCKICRTAF